MRRRRYDSQPEALLAESDVRCAPVSPLPSQLAAGYFCILTVAGATLEEITDGNRAAVLALRVTLSGRSGRSVNVEHGLATDAAVQQGVDRTLRLTP